MNEKKMEKYYIWLAEKQQPHGEGVVAAQTELGLTPLASASRDVALQMRGAAEVIGKAGGSNVTLVEFERARELETIVCRRS